ncbi:MAG TPA: DUF2304 domain-containing protein [Verrucomicrobiae bacterium]|jgi:hypothetical protein|nr:DUF2304 domain-containing protein [Verrucomicrobiae bacterium]
MQAYGHSLVFITTLIVFFFVLWLVRRRAIGERFAVLWLLISVFLLLASSLGYPYLFQIAKLVGVPYPPSALFFLAIAGLTLLIIELFAWVSKLNDRTRVLTQQLAILREQVERGQGTATEG